MNRDYGQHCGLAHALDLIGGRWALLIVRDLLTGPKRFKELQGGLPGIPTNVLTDRLRELGDAGLVERRVESGPGGAVVYALTDYGLEIEGAVLALGSWGAKTLQPPQKGEFIPVSALALALRAAFVPPHGRGPKRVYELRIDGTPLRVGVQGRQAAVPDLSAEPADVVIDTDALDFSELLMGRMDIDTAVSSGRVQIHGDDADARRFFELFHLAVLEDTTAH
jgi:DNA-binding HxlR family transcriptional regulator